MIANGTKVRVTEILEKDFDFLDGEFEELSQMLNGREGIVVKHLPAQPEYGEREAYMIRFDIPYDIKEYELETDEFEVVELFS